MVRNTFKNTVEKDERQKEKAEKERQRKLRALLPYLRSKITGAAKAAANQGTNLSLCERELISALILIREFKGEPTKILWK